jgi:hypothetical protein
MATVLLRKGAGPPGAGALANGEPCLDMTPATGAPGVGPKLYAGVGGVPVLIADPAYIAMLEARIALLEAAVRELQFRTWVSTPLLPGNIIP